MHLRKLTFESTLLFAALCLCVVISSCTGGKSGISASSAPGADSGSAASFKVLTFQGNSSSSWNTYTASIWKTNLNSVTLTGTCTRGIATIQVSQRLAGSGGQAVDSGVTANCTNGAFSWTKNFASDPNYLAAAFGNAVQYDFNVFALDGLGTKVLDSSALSAVRLNKLANTVLTNVQFNKGYVLQTVPVSGSAVSISDTPDSDIGGAGHCPTSVAGFTLNGTFDPEASISVSGASATNNSSGSTLSFLVCVPFGSTSLVLGTKDETGTSAGPQISINISSTTVLQTLGSASEGFKFQNLSPNLAGLSSQGLNLINISSDQFGKANTVSTGVAGYTISTGLSSYVQQASP